MIRKALVRNQVPTVPGGGTVTYVHAAGQHYLDDPAHREEAGTPAIVESIRAGLVFQLKQAVDPQVIVERERSFARRAIASWRTNPAIEILGDPDADRLPIVSFVVHTPNGRRLHHNFVVALLNDLFGIQSRGGCSCAGPYAHRLLGIDLNRAHELAREAAGGRLGIRPGWTRVSFSFYLPDTEFAYIVAAVHLAATHGARLLPDYRFDPASGLWRHHDAPPPHASLRRVAYDIDGHLRHPATQRGRAQEDALAEYLDQARAILAERPDPGGDGWDPAVLDGLEHLRWFELPVTCLTGPKGVIDLEPPGAGSGDRALHVLRKPEQARLGRSHE